MASKLQEYRRIRLCLHWRYALSTTGIRAGKLRGQLRFNLYLWRSFTLMCDCHFGIIEEFSISRYNRIRKKRRRSRS